MALKTLMIMMTGALALGVSLATVLVPMTATGVPVHGAAAAGDTAEVRLVITGMTCGSCATTARIALERAEGVYDARVSYDSASAVVRYDPEKTTPERFIAHVEEMTGYKARVVEPADKPKEGP